MATVTVEYDYRFPFRYPTDGRRVRFPGLLLRLRSPITQQSIEALAHIDTGASASLFDGSLATAIGLDLLAGRQSGVTFLVGAALPSRVHDVSVQHEVLGDFEIPLAFSTSVIRRNVLGRDFLAYVQLGFNERDLEFYIVTH